MWCAPRDPTKRPGYVSGQRIYVDGGGQDWRAASDAVQAAARE